MNDDLAYRFLATLRENTGSMEYVDLMNAIGGDPNVAYDQLAILKSRRAVRAFCPSTARLSSLRKVKTCWIN